MKIKSMLASVAVATVLALRGQAQNLITNGSFESPVIPGNSFERGTPTGWSGGAFIFNGNNGSDYPAPEVGNQFADIGDEVSGPFSQTLTVPATGVYLLSWYGSSAPEQGGYAYEVYATGNSTNVYEENADATWNAQSRSLTLNAGTNTVAFQAILTSTDTLIDNVSLVRIPVISLIQARALETVTPAFSYLLVGTNYQLQVSGNLTDWTNQGSAFMATSTNMVYPQSWNVDSASWLFFRLQISP